jgi:hypothetical protein
MKRTFVRAVLLNILIILLCLCNYVSADECSRKCGLYCGALQKCSTDVFTCACTTDGGAVIGIIVAIILGCVSCCYCMGAACFRGRNTQHITTVQMPIQQQQPQQPQYAQGQYPQQQPQYYYPAPPQQPYPAAAIQPNGVMIQPQQQYYSGSNAAQTPIINNYSTPQQPQPITVAS